MYITQYIDTYRQSNTSQINIKTEHAAHASYLHLCAFSHSHADFVIVLTTQLFSRFCLAIYGREQTWLTIKYWQQQRPAALTNGWLSVEINAIKR